MSANFLLRHDEQASVLCIFFVTHNEEVCLSPSLPFVDYIWQAEVIIFNSRLGCITAHISFQTIRRFNLVAAETNVNVLYLE